MKIGITNAQLGYIGKNVTTRLHCVSPLQAKYTK